MSVAKISSSVLEAALNTYQPTSSFAPLLSDLKRAKCEWTLDERGAFWAKHETKILQIFPQNILTDLDFIPTDLFQRIVKPLITPLTQRGIYCAMATTNDFGTSIKKLRFAASVPGKSHIEHLVENMKEIAKLEGFELDISELFIYLRDHCVKLENGKIVFSTSNDSLLKTAPKAIERLMSNAVYFNKSALSSARHPLFWEMIGSPLLFQAHERALYDYAQKHLGKNLEELLFYFEGGNLFTLTNRYGKRKLFMGRGHLTLIHSNWRLAKLFEHPDIVQKTGGIKPAEIERIQKSLTKEKIEEIAEEMYSLGLIKEGIGFIDVPALCEQNDSAKDLMSNHVFAIQSKIIKPPQWTDKEINGLKPLVAKYLVQKEFILKLLSGNFGVPIEDIHFLPEVGYHLDTFMMPGPNRTVFIQDHQLCLKALASLKEAAKSLSFTENDLTLLDRYQKIAKQLQEDLGGHLKEAREEIARAGLTPIPTPGFFCDLPEKLTFLWKNKGLSQTFNVQFLNAISGWSEKNKRPYFITTGAHVGNRLGDALMNLFEQFMKQYQPDLQVHFVGYNPKNPKDFSTAMQWWNDRPALKSPNAGVRCLSFEEEAVSHAYPSIIPLF